LRRRIGSAGLAVGLLCVVGSLWAHHSTTAEFDVSKRFTLTGTLTKVDWVNPHIFYEDISGDAYRIIPTDGSPHRADANPSCCGDSVGRWEGNTLVVDVTNFVDDTWFGEGGYFHTDAMHVTERFWRDGANLAYQVTPPNLLRNRPSASKPTPASSSTTTTTASGKQYA
jgi:hypothetical protein